MENNMFFKHLFGFLTMVFFVVLSGTNRSKSPDFFQDAAKSVGLYVMFIILTKNTFPMFIAIVSLLCASFIVEIRIKDIDAQMAGEKEAEEAVLKDRQKNKMLLENVNNILTYTALCTMLGGCILYFGQKRIEYNKSFSLISFFFGKPTCREKSPKNIATLDALNAAFFGHK
jgi:fucose permease